MPTIRQSRLLIRPAAGMGRGVFADRSFEAGEIIEVCPVIPISTEDEAKLSATILDQYLFAWGDAERTACLALGFGGLYNHSPTPNAVVYEANALTQLEFVALREIEKGEQITIDYQWEEGEYGFPHSNEPAAQARGN